MTRSKFAGTPMTMSLGPCLTASRKKPRRCAHQLYSIVALRSEATRAAILFSKPSSLSLLKGRLFGSAAMWRTRGAGCVVAAPHNDDVMRSTAPKPILRKREHIEHASFCRVLGEFLHRVDEAERAGWVRNIQISCDDGARPTADA